MVSNRKSDDFVEKSESSNSKVKYSVKNNHSFEIQDSFESAISEENENQEDVLNTVGVILSTKRKELKLSIDDVANSLKIKQKYIKAIEENEFQVLPGCTYAIGFIKSYSKFLHLDTGLIISIYKQQIDNNNDDFEYKENVQMTPLKEASDFRNYLIIFIIFFLILSSAVFAVKLIITTLFKNEKVNQQSNVSINVATIPEDKQNITIKDNDNNVNSVMSSDSSNIVKEDKDIDKSKQLDTFTNTEKSNKIYGYDNKIYARIVLKATGTSWIKLKKAGLYVYDEKKGDIGTGSTVFEGTLYNGDVYYIPNDEDLYLTIGNAKYIDIYLDENKLKALSNVDNTSKLNIELTPEKLKSNN